MIFSGSEQLNRWVCHLLPRNSHGQSESTQHYRVQSDLNTCDLWDIWSEWWGDMARPKSPTFLHTYPPTYLPTYLPIYLTLGKHHIFKPAFPQNGGICICFLGGITFGWISGQFSQMGNFTLYFRHASISSTYPCPSVCKSAGWSHFRISNLWSP